MKHPKEIKISDFNSYLSNKGIPQVISVMSDEYIDNSEIYKTLKDTLKKKIPDLDIYYYEGKTFDFNDFFNNFDSFSLFSDSRFFYIKDINDLKNPGNKHKKNIEKFLEKLSDISEETYILFTMPYISKTKQNKFIKSILNISTKINFNIYNFNPAMWVKNYVKKNNCEITNEAVEKLLNFCNNNRSLIKSELEKIFLYVYDSDSKKITLDIIKEIAFLYSDDDIFSFIDLFLSKKIDKSIEKFYDILSYNINLSALTINLIDKINKLIVFKNLKKNINNIKKLEIEMNDVLYKRTNYYEFQDLIKYEKLYSIKELLLFQKRLLELDYSQKNFSEFYNISNFNALILKNK